MEFKWKCLRKHHCILLYSLLQYSYSDPIWDKYMKHWFHELCCSFLDCYMAFDVLFWRYTNSTVCVVDLWFMNVVCLACEEMKDIDMNWSETAVMWWVKADLSVWWCSLLVFNRILFAFLSLIYSNVHSFALDEK